MYHLNNVLFLQITGVYGLLIYDFRLNNRIERDGDYDGKHANIKLKIKENNKNYYDTKINKKVFCKFCMGEFSRSDNLKRHLNNNKCKILQLQKQQKENIFINLLEEEKINNETEKKLNKIGIINNPVVKNKKNVGNIRTIRIKNKVDGKTIE